MFPLEVQIASGVRARKRKVVNMDGHMRLELRPGWERFCADLARERFGLAAGLLSCGRWACVVVVSIAAVVATASDGVSGTALIVVGTVAVIVARG